MENLNKWSMKVILPVPGKNPINPKQKNKCCNREKREDRKTQGHIQQSLGHTVEENYTLHNPIPAQGSHCHPSCTVFTPQLLLQHIVHVALDYYRTDSECPREPQEPRELPG